MGNLFCTTISKDSHLEIATSDGIIKISLSNKHKTKTASIAVITDKRLEITILKDEKNGSKSEN